MATPKPAETTTAVQTEAIEDSEALGSKKMDPVPVMSPEEVKHFQDLGLGRGVDSSDSRLWKNKSPMQIRTVSQDLGNIIGTDESGIKHNYEKVVSSLRTQQAKIQTSLSDPSSVVKIGLDAHYSQSNTSTVIVKGTKVQTRTISFQYEFDDLTRSDRSAAALIHSIKDNGFSTFENNLAAWILEQLLAKQREGTIPPTPEIKKLHGETAIDKLSQFTEQVQNVESVEAKAIETACRDFVFNFGITHYVSSIELGALKYSVETNQTRSTQAGAGGIVGATSSAVSASVGASADVVTEVRQKTKNVQEIGYFDGKGVVRRDTSDEAVIGFQIQPLSKLTRLPLVQIAMKVAIEIYLKSKTDESVGPFLISTTINKTPVYWKVDKEHLSLVGTEDIQAASLFYIMSAGDQFYPSSFTFAYWGDKKDDRKYITDLNSRLTKLRLEAPKLPTFLTTNTSAFCSPKRPLLFKSTFDMKTAEYTIHSRIRTSLACLTCLMGSESLQTWMEGDEFYVKHRPSVFKSVYVAIERESGATHTPSYRGTVVPNFRTAEKRPEAVGMLFRLHPFQFQKLAGKTEVSGRDIEESLEESMKMT